jgi:hypothetical protein
MKKETKRIYKFTFEQLKAALNIEGEFQVYVTKDDKGKESKDLTIITLETKEE